MALMEQVERYVALKQALGLSFREPAQLLRNYAAHAGACGEGFVVGATAIDWAVRTSSIRQARKRRSVVRGLAVLLYAEDPRHDVPSPDYFGPRETRRKPPNLLSREQIRQIMDAALSLPPPPPPPRRFDHPTDLSLHAGAYRIDRPSSFGGDQPAAYGYHTGRLAHTQHQVRRQPARPVARRRVPCHRRISGRQITYEQPGRTPVPALDRSACQSALRDQVSCRCPATGTVRPMAFQASRRTAAR